MLLTQALGGDADSISFIQHLLDKAGGSEARVSDQGRPASLSSSGSSSSESSSNENSRARSRASETYSLLSSALEVESQGAEVCLVSVDEDDEPQLEATMTVVDFGYSLLERFPGISNDSSDGHRKLSVYASQPASYVCFRLCVEWVEIGNVMPRKGCGDTAMKNVRPVTCFVILADNDFTGFDPLHIQVKSGHTSESDSDGSGSGGEEVHSLGDAKSFTLTQLQKKKGGFDSWVCWSDGLHAKARAKDLSKEPWKAPKSTARALSLHFSFCNGC